MVEDEWPDHVVCGETVRNVAHRSRQQSRQSGGQADSPSERILRASNPKGACSRGMAGPRIEAWQGPFTLRAVDNPSDRFRCLCPMFDRHRPAAKAGYGREPCIITQKFGTQSNGSCGNNCVGYPEPMPTAEGDGGLLDLRRQSDDRNRVEKRSYTCLTTCVQLLVGKQLNLGHHRNTETGGLEQFL